MPVGLSATSSLFPRRAFQNGLKGYACVVAAASWVVVFAGGLVTSTGSGLAVPDWPLSFGTFFPPMVGGVLFEHGHRMLAGGVGLLVFGLTAWVLIAEEVHETRRLVVAASLGILLQAGLGGLTVLLKLPPWISIIHACLGQLMFVLLTWIAYNLLTKRLELSRGGPTGLLKIVSGLGVSVVFLQLVAGAILRHTGLALEWHVAGAFGVTFMAAWMYRSWRIWSLQDPLIAWIRRGLALLVGIQVGLGLLTYVIRWTFWWSTSVMTGNAFVTLHQAVGALVLASMFLSLVHARRCS